MSVHGWIVALVLVAILVGLLVAVEVERWRFRRRRDRGLREIYEQAAAEARDPVRRLRW